MTDIPDLDNPDDIGTMVRRFYTKVGVDELLGPLFNDVAKVDWPEHFDKLTAFWCRALIGQPGYAGNPFRAHANIHNQSEFTRAHFEHWLRLFHETIDADWAGPHAEGAKQMARRVAAVHANQLIGEPVEFDPASRSIPIGATPGSTASA